MVGVPVFEPASQPTATLFGRPILFAEKLPTLGTQGDILLIDPMMYTVGLRAGITFAISPHLYFNTNELAFRLRVRVDGKSLWDKVLHFAVVRSLAAAVLACALTDLLKGRDTAEILSWIQGRPAALPFWMGCRWLDISPRETRERLRAIAAEPDALTRFRAVLGHSCVDSQRRGVGRVRRLECGPSGWGRTNGGGENWRLTVERPRSSFQTAGRGDGVAGP